MGEAGAEAVMPLKRGADGKLGVAGGGGSVIVNYAPVIQAVDTRSGLEFLAGHKQAIVNLVTLAANRASRYGPAGK
jgi:phage-related minor tail protein